MKEDYTICLYGFEVETHVQSREVNGRLVDFHVAKGSYIGGVVRFAECETLEEAISKVKKMWVENFEGKVRQAVIKKDTVWIWQSNNFNLLK
jgi:hypothetical protein